MRSHTHECSNESAHVIVVMSHEEDIDTTKLKHMMHVINVQEELKLYFYLNFFVHVSMVKQDILWKLAGKEQKGR
jgi:hypothetical protein